jgi:hypothetical protein
MRLDQTEYHKATVKGGGGARTAEAICRSTCRKLKCVGGEDKKMSRGWSVVKKQDRPEFSSPSCTTRTGLGPKTMAQTGGLSTKWLTRRRKSSLKAEIACSLC